MSETPQPTFAEAKGTEANQHAKKLAKANSVKKTKKHKEFYTKLESKVLSFHVQANGVYKKYVGNLKKKKEADHLKTQIDIWKKNGLWIEESEYKTFVTKSLDILNK